MTTYTTIANSQIDLDSPITEPLMTALRDNPIAIAEGAVGAPKIADSIRYASGNAFGAATISNVDVGSGARIDVCFYVNQSELAGDPVYFELSENGTTWTNKNSLATGEGDYYGTAVLHIDFANNSWRSIYYRDGAVRTVGALGGSLTSAEGTAYIRVWTDAGSGSLIHIIGVVTGGFATS